MTTLGRGGSDTTPSRSRLHSAPTHARSTQTSTASSPPTARRSRAQKLHAVSYEEMLELAASGAKVLALRSVEFARNHGAMVHVRSTFTDEPGTWIREEDERMLEKALISADAHVIEEAVYEVDDVRPADLFEALAEAEVNVDTVIQMDSRIVFLGAGRGPRQRRAGPREARHRVLRAARAGEGERRRRRDEEPSWSRLPHLRRALRELGVEPVRGHLPDQDRVLRAAGFGRGDRSRPARQLRARLAGGGEAPRC